MADDQIDDVLTYALFPQIGLKFLQNRGDASAFEPVPTLDDAVVDSKPAAASAAPNEVSVYTVSVSGQSFVVQVSEGGDVSDIQPIGSVQGAPVKQSSAPTASPGENVPSPLAGNIFRILVSPGQQVEEGDTVMILEAMKMEAEISAPRSGVVGSINVKEGDSVKVGQSLLTL